MARQLGAGSKVALLVLPWTFLTAFAAIYALVLVPKILDGAWLAFCAGAFAAFAFVAFAVAAVTLSRDVIMGRWPE